MIIKFEAHGFDEMKRGTARSSTIVKGGIVRTLREYGAAILPILKRFTPVRTGRLRNSTRFQIIGAGLLMRLMIRQGAKTKEGEFYGHIVRGGSRPHVILPRVAKALVFKIGDRTIFARRVNHPGTKPNQYHVRTLKAARPQLLRISKRNAVAIEARVFQSGRAA